MYQVGDKTYPRHVPHWIEIDENFSLFDQPLIMKSKNNPKPTKCMIKGDGTAFWYGHDSGPPTHYWSF
jgi:hypothetical protein